MSCYKKFNIERATAVNLIRTLEIAQYEGFYYDNVDNLLDELKKWVKYWVV